MKRKMDRTGLPHIITVVSFVVFIVLGLACASKPKNIEELTTYSENIEVNGLSQSEIFFKVKMFFDEAFKGLTLSAIQTSDQNNGIINGKLVTDKFQHANKQLRYNSMFTIEIRDEECQITFTNPTIQDIGFISEQAKEIAFQNYMLGRRAVSSALSLVTSNVMMSSNQQVNLSNEQIRAEWEKNNVFSSNNPSVERPVQYDYQILNIRGEWEKLVNELKYSITQN